jgi:YD repeat-containing protein
LANPEAYGGGCVADMHFELVDGSTAGAQLLIVGNTTVRADKHLRVGNDAIDESIPMNLLDAYTLEDYNPGSFQLLLADGRLYDLTVERGIVRFADRNDNWMFIDDDRLVHSDGRQIDMDRDALGRIVRIRDPKGQTVSYGYDAQGDLTSVRDQESLITRFVYHNEPAHHLQSIVRPDGVTVAAMEYNAEGELRRGAPLHAFHLRSRCSQSGHHVAGRDPDEVRIRCAGQCHQADRWLGSFGPVPVRRG